MDVRVYDGKTGKLIKVFSNFIDDTKSIELFKFCSDSKGRKLFIGNINGKISIYNANNGLLVKSVNNMFSHGIAGIAYDTDGGNIIAAFNDSCIRIYEDFIDEEAVQIRKIRGGHNDSPISCMDYSYLLGLIATGAINGSITIWDYEMSRIEGQCYQHSTEILDVKFVEGYPVIVSSGNDGLVCIFGVRGANSKTLYQCLARIYNFSQHSNENISFSVKSIATLPLTKLKRKPNQNKSLSKDYLDIEVVGEEGVAVILGDEGGYVRVIDIKSLMDYYSISPIKTPWKYIKLLFNPKRKGSIDVTYHYKDKQNIKKAPILPLENSMLNKWKAHNDQITSILVIPQPAGFVSAAVDQHVKLWSIEGDKWGCLAIVGKESVVSWNFPYDWEEIKRTEKKSLIKVVEEIDPSNECDKELIRIEDTFYNTEETKEHRSVVPKVKKVRKKSTLKIKESIAPIVIKENPAKSFLFKLNKKKEVEGKLVEDAVSLMEYYKSGSKESKDNIKVALSELKSKMSNLSIIRI